MKNIPESSTKRRHSYHGKVTCYKLFVQRCCIAVHLRRSQIYCESGLMHDIQMAAIYPDSKTFVDKKLKYTEAEIMKKYEDLKLSVQNGENMHHLLVKFVDENFEDGDELEVWVPPDFTSRPSLVDRIADPEYKNWALALNEIWKTLARKIKDDVKTHPELYSLIWVPNGFCIPGGRFRELYYWDTYWIVNGLLLCDMKETARGIIENIISMVNRFGFMPNGNRVYYLNRSQPPLLILMVFNYFQATKDFNFIMNNIETLTTEFEFWMTNRMVKFEKNGKTYHMARYYAPSQGPRPESYREDYEIAHEFDSSQDRDTFYTRIKSAAETGWDFSSRWFIKDGSSHGSLRDINAPGIIPVDLNAFLHANALALSTWWIRMGNEQKSRRYRDIANEFLRGLQDVLWREDIGTWLDWDLVNKKHRVFNDDLRLIEQLRKSDRAIIYVFIAACYAPWLMLVPLPEEQMFSSLQWLMWLFAGFGVLFELTCSKQFPVLGIACYIIYGLIPAIFLDYQMNFPGIMELKIAGGLYLIGVGFYRCDGIVPFAHAIWHLCVILGATVHYLAVLNHFYSDSNESVSKISEF